MNTLNHCFLYKIIDLGYVQPEAVPDAAQKLVRVEEPPHGRQRCQLSQSAIRPPMPRFPREFHAWRRTAHPVAEGPVQPAVQRPGQPDSRISEDFSRSADEALLAEIMPSLRGIHHAAKPVRKCIGASG